jgi:hypothetical protein
MHRNKKRAIRSPRRRGEQVRWNFDHQHPRGLRVDDEFELGGTAPRATATLRFCKPHIPVFEELSKTARRYATFIPGRTR